MGYWSIRSLTGPWRWSQMARFTPLGRTLVGPNCAQKLWVSKPDSFATICVRGRQRLSLLAVRPRRRCERSRFHLRPGSAAPYAKKGDASGFDHFVPHICRWLEIRRTSDPPSKLKADKEASQRSPTHAVGRETCSNGDGKQESEESRNKARETERGPRVAMCRCQGQKTAGLSVLMRPMRLLLPSSPSSLATSNSNKKRKRGQQAAAAIINATLSRRSFERGPAD
ncbi:hypothetical protein B0J13DRAFT_521892 [Dactylonectria estremocensis]|uniref:Uncharacterized protein n=1 Tax=Dactylonectria estremocensis TaxID=1079267 RepID=A0A9P9F5C1_9HYPO|nr:hypothetical protein B0J13DRAFT_521892 [Dactylonectria estremocensis]